MPGLQDKPWMRLIIFLTAVPIFLLYCLVATGCISTSPGVSNIYTTRLIELDGAGARSSSPEIRAGYFGMCIGNTKSSLSCLYTWGSSVHELIGRFQLEMNSSNEQLVGLACILQAKIVLLWIVVSGVVFLIGVGFVTTWKVHSRKKNAAERGKTILKRGTLSMLWLSSALCLAAAISTTQTSGGLQWYSNVTRATVAIEQGAIVEALQWTLCVLTAVFALGVTILLSGDSDGAPAQNYKINLPST